MTVFWEIKSNSNIIINNDNNKNNIYHKNTEQNNSKEIVWIKTEQKEKQ